MDAARNVCASHSNPPTLLEKKEAHEVRMKCPQLDWHNQQLCQVLALNCKGEALAMFKAPAAGEYEGTRAVPAWKRLTPRSPWIQRAKNSGIGLESFPSPALCQDVGYFKSP